MPINLVLVDDHPLVLNGLQQLLTTEPEFEVLAACTTAEEGFAAVESHHPDVLVLDLNLPDSHGLELLRRLDSSNRPGVVVLTASQDEDEWLEAARLGARAIVLKAMAPRVLEDSIRTVHGGGSILNVGAVDISQRLAERQSAESELGALLTPRELEIVGLAATRLDNMEIAAKLSITTGTVKIHLHHVYEKLHVEGRQELMQYLRAKQY